MATDDELLARLARLEATIAALDARVAALEPTHPPAFPSGDEGAREAPGGPMAPSSPFQPPHEPTRRGEKPPDWENLIAGRWALWVGSLAIFLAVAFFLAYTWQFLGPTARIAGGFGLGTALLAWAWLVRRRAEPWFAEGLAGAGLGLFYLNIWSAYKTHALIGTQPAFGALLAVTALGAFLAVRYDAKSQIALATAGGFLTPLVIGDAGGRDLGTAVYALILDAGLLAISLFRRWPGLGWACMAGTLVLWATNDAVGQPWPAFAVLSATFALFAGTAVGYSLRRGERTAPHDVLLLLAAAFIYAPAGYWLIDAELGAWRPTFPLALAGTFAGVGLAARALVPTNAPFRIGADALAVFFFTLAIPTWLAHDRLTIAWIVEAALLTALGARFDDVVFRRLGYVVAAAAAFAAAIGAYSLAPAGAWPIVNPRTLPLVVAIAAAGGVIAFARAQVAARPARGAVVALVVATLAWLACDAQTLAYLDAAAFIPSDATARLAAGGAALLAWAYFAAATRWSTPALRVGALVLWAIGACWLVFEDFFGEAAVPRDWRPLGTALVLAGGLAIAAGARRTTDAGPRETRMTGLLGLALVLVAVWGLSIEAQGIVRALAQAGWERQAQLAISLVWIVSAVACLLTGIRTHARPFRLLGLGLLGASVIKVFAFDLAFLDTPYRIAAFAGLGAALIGISWLYGRYGLTPRGDTTAPPPASEP